MYGRNTPVGAQVQWNAVLITLKHYLYYYLRRVRLSVTEVPTWWCFAWTTGQTVAPSPVKFAQLIDQGCATCL